ncbi:MAG: S46 family peptidase [Acidobacteria bacterium]|nr:S46 family peptidase [Acidobacteriota bacterium]
MGLRNGFSWSQKSILIITAFFVFTGASIWRTLADEGMWTFDNPPLKMLKERYGFTPSKDWLDHVRLSSVRFNDGGSGSFVSPNGLVLTNHHVARGQLQKISTQNKDYVKDGFYASAQAKEIKTTDLELNVLVSMENVTTRVKSVVKPGMNDKEALIARHAEIARIEKESVDQTGLRSDVISLYQGGEYWLYRYKKYTDVRLVFAPEQQIAFYGGDPDNFTYPRYDLDMALFRVYENDKPVESKHYLKWNAKGAADGELVFVSGHPGSTDRLDTMAQLEMIRDHLLPQTIATIKRRLEVLKKYSALGAEHARQAQGLTFSLENSLKALTGELDGLRDKEIMARKQKEEEDFRARVNSNPEWREAYGGAWEAIARAEQKQLEMLKQLRYRSFSRSFSDLVGFAQTIVRYVAEVKKPDAERLDGYHEAQLASLKFELFSSAPVYPQMEEQLLADSLQESLSMLGPEDPFIKAVLQGRTPAAAAKELIGGTKLADPAYRKSLVEGGEAAVAASTDPLIVMVRTIEPMLREQRALHEANVQSVIAAAGEKIGLARFAVYGKTIYPDANFTLRLSYGTVKGYPMNGTIAPPKTTFYGLYDRAYSFDQKPPFDLPARYRERRERLNLATPLDFVTTNDIIGGNSGSPVINRNAELVGLIFDGNMESLVGRFIYDDTANRAVAVHSASMIEALRKIYDAGALADELEGVKARAAGN